MTLFERREYLSRVDRTKERMAARGIDVLLVASPANQFYLTGYDGCSFYTPQMVVVSLAQEEPVWVGRAMDAAGAKFTAFLTPDNVVPYPDTYVGSGERHPMEFVADVVRQRGWDRGAIGVEMDDYYYTARWHEILTRDLPNARLVDAFLLVNWTVLHKLGAQGRAWPGSSRRCWPGARRSSPSGHTRRRQRRRSDRACRGSRRRGRRRPVGCASGR